MVEAARLGRVAIGCDIDPLAVFVSRVKSRPLAQRKLMPTVADLYARISPLERDARTYERFKFSDLGPRKYRSETSSLDIPAIPNLLHWFRRYVVVDLARLRCAIRHTDAPAAHIAFLELCFASIIRGVSNADPVPVSGLEVTAHMKRLDAQGRLINPFAMFKRVTNRAIKDMDAYADEVSGAPPVTVLRQNATELRMPKRVIDVVITSPPYHGAVDYYRRHQLEMFWLDLVRSQEERLVLLRGYIGRSRPAKGHAFIKDGAITSETAAAVESQIRVVSDSRADAFKHYCVGMTKVFEQVAQIIRPGRPVVLVVGHSTWNRDRLNTSSLFASLAQPAFSLVEHLWYPVRNRYMSYSRHNDANIDREYVLVLERNHDA